MREATINSLQEWGPYGDLRTMQIVVCSNPKARTRPAAVHLHNVDQGAFRAALTRIEPSLANGSGHLLAGIDADVTLSPADGSVLTGSIDMSLMAAVMAARFLEAESTEDLAFCGEVLGERFLPLTRPLAMAKATADSGLTLVCSAESAPLARIANPKVIGLHDVWELRGVVCGERPYHKDSMELTAADSGGVDMQFVKGQQRARRALEIAVAGGHNMLMIGPPGEGKSLLAKTIPTIAPELDLEAALEVTPVHQAQGLIEPGEVITRPPLRMVDPTVTKQALLGGGHLEPYPGEVSLAHRGTLFADEMLQFTRTTLEALRTPMQDRQVSISRVNWKVTFPAAFQLVAACNPCPCGYWGHPDVECRCTPAERRRYVAKLSGPVIDRIDVRVWVEPLGDERFKPSDGEPSAAIAERVQDARARQQARYTDQEITTNAELGPSTMQTINLHPKSEDTLRALVTEQHLSTRGKDNVLKLSRTVADLDGSDIIEPDHITEAAEYIEVKLPDQ